MDGLRSNISLRVYAQKDPLVEYKNEAYDIFKVLMDRIYRDITLNLFRATLATLSQLEEMLRSLPRELIHQTLAQFDAGIPMAMMEAPQEEAPSISVDGTAELASGPQLTVAPIQPMVRDAGKIGRNEDCPCGSGKKFKKCCGRYE